MFGVLNCDCWPYLPGDHGSFLWGNVAVLPGKKTVAIITKWPNYQGGCKAGFHHNNLFFFYNLGINLFKIQNNKNAKDGS